MAAGRKGTRSFSKTITNFTLKTRKRKRDILRGIVRGVVRVMLKNYPVGDKEYWKNDRWKAWADRVGYRGGLYAANLSVSVDRLPNKVFVRDFSKADPDASTLKQERNEVVRTLKTNSRIYFAAFAPYAAKIEEGYAGSNPRSNSPVLGPAAESFKEILGEAIRQAKADNK